MLPEVVMEAETANPAEQPNRRVCCRKSVFQKWTLRFGYFYMVILFIFLGFMTYELGRTYDKDIQKEAISYSVSGSKPAVATEIWAKFYLGIVLISSGYWVWKTGKLIVNTKKGWSSVDCWKFAPFWKRFVLFYMILVSFAIYIEREFVYVGAALYMSAVTIYFYAWCLHGLEKDKRMACVNCSLVYVARDVVRQNPAQNDNQSMIEMQVF